MSRNAIRPFHSCARLQATRPAQKSIKSSNNSVGTSGSRSLPPSLIRNATEPNSRGRIDAQGNFKTYKPVSPGLRHLKRPVQPDYLYTGKPMRHLTIAKRSTGGRNESGHVTVRGRGGGHRRRYRLVDFKRLDDGAEHEVMRIELDPNRSGHIALIRRTDHEERKDDYNYILAPDGIKQGDRLKSWRNGFSSESSTQKSGANESSGSMPEGLTQALMRSAALKPGNLLPLYAIPIGTSINSISLTPTGPGVLCRAAGASASVVNVGDRWAQVRLQSGEIRQINKNCSAVIGAIGNKLHASRQLGKAGRSRWLGRRPKVRGVAMNAVDHPHGGGRGKSKGNKQPRSPTGVLAKGYRTRRPGARGNQFVIKQRPRGKAKAGSA